MSLRDRVLSTLAGARAEGLAFNALIRRLGGGEDRELVRRLVDSMVITGRIVRLESGRLVDPEPLDWVVGRLSVTRKGLGFVIPADVSQDDLMILKSALADANDGDRVAAQPIGNRRGRPAGAIVAVLDRAHRRLVGQYFHSTRGRATVTPKAKRLGRTVHVAPLPRAKARDGLWVAVEVTEWTDMPDPLQGRIVDILGEEGAPDTDLPVMLEHHGVDPEFPEAALRETEEIPLEIPAATLARRRNLRDTTIFTIDPETAKDFDDALSIEVLDGGRWRLGVHIADVAEHVCPGTALDAMARDRGTSIYPIDKVIPMLPERLSNMVCSLRPEEDSLTLSVFMVIDAMGDFAESPDLCESVIHSARRLDYGQAQRVFDGETTEEDRAATAGLEGDLLALRDVARALTAMRRRRGALDLDLPEVEILLDEDRRVNEIVRRPRWESHRLVEECMLAANEAVALHLTKSKVPTVYRDHDEPDTERLARAIPALRALGVRERIPAHRTTAKDYQRVLERTMHLKTRRVAHRLLLRSLKLAVYDPENRGHFGLASPCYTHFTSPIRRYPDLIVHRILKDRLRGVPLPKGPAREVWEEELAALAALSSARERRAERVERDMTKLKTLQYIEPQLGREAAGMIAGVSSRGLWVELDDVPVEGFVAIETLPEDWYEFDEEVHALIGEDTRLTFRLGQEVKVKLVSIDLVALELDLVIVMGKGSSRGKRGKGPPHSHRRPRRRR